MSYLNPGLANPVPSADGLDVEYWKATRQERLVMQRCGSCKRYQWGPEWICHHCLSDDVRFEEISKVGVIYSWERVWHPVHPALNDQGPYLIALVEFPQYDNARMLGNLVGDPLQEVTIGWAVEAVFEHHDDVDHPFTLVHWRVIDA